MNKAELVKKVRKGFPNTQNMVDRLFRAINSSLVNQEEVNIYNFGTFYITKKKVNHAYDFKQRKIIPWSEGKYRIKFRASRVIEKILNEKAKSNST